VRPRLLAVAASLLYLAGSLEAAGRDCPPSPVRFAGSRSGTFEKVLAAAFADAAAWLRRDPCVRLLSEFRDLAGRPLSDGDRSSVCQSSRVLAGTRPGSGEVAFCGRRFERTQMQDRDLAAAIVIHEELHALGLGENPPTTEEITGRVLERCRR
jgi:hypothetical protein